MFEIRSSLFLKFLTAFLAAGAMAAVDPSPSAQTEHSLVEGKIIEAIEKRLGVPTLGVSIELMSDVRGVTPEQLTRVRRVHATQLFPRGEAQLAMGITLEDGTEKTFDALVSYRAWAKAWISKKRIAPLEKISIKDFSQERIDVSSGRNFEFRGAIMPVLGVNLEKLESKQTILEGSYLLSSAVQKLPDIRRGDSVKVQIITGTLRVTSLAIAQESGFADSQVRVVTQGSKKTLTGKLNTDGVVEIRL